MSVPRPHTYYRHTPNHPSMWVAVCLPAACPSQLTEEETETLTAQRKRQAAVWPTTWQLLPLKNHRATVKMLVPCAVISHLTIDGEPHARVVVMNQVVAIPCAYLMTAQQGTAWQQALDHLGPVDNLP